MATVCFYAPDPIQSCQLIPGGNTPANGGQLFFYAAGSSTKQTVYKDPAAAVAWSNPIVLDSGGNLPLGGEVWFPTGQTFKVIFAPANDSDPPVSPYWTKDNLSGINDVSLQTGVEWLSGPTPTFVSATSFTLAGDQTLIFTKGRRIRTTNTGGTIYSTITTVSFAGVTTVTVVNDAGVLDAGLSAVFYGLFDPANRSINETFTYRSGAAVASAATTNIWGTVGDYIHITGTTTINSFSTAPYAGSERTIIFDGALSLNTSAAIAIPGGFGVTTSANDRATVRAETVSTAIITGYTLASGLPFTSPQNSGTVFTGPSSGAAALPTFRVPSATEGASMILLETQRITVASSSVLLSQFSTAYDKFQIDIANASPTVNGNLQFRLANTSQAIITGNVYGLINNVTGINSTSYSNFNNVGTGTWFVNGTTNTVAAGGNGWNGSITLPNSQTTTGIVKSAYWIGTYDGTVTGGAIVTGAGNCNSSSINSSSMGAVQFTFGAGNISTGTFTLYGFRKT